MRWGEMTPAQRDQTIESLVLRRLVSGEELFSTAGASTEMGSTWRLVEQLNNCEINERGRVTLATLEYGHSAHAWYASFQAAIDHHRAWTVGAWATHAPDALCQAALLVMGYDLEDLPELR